MSRKQKMIRIEATASASELAERTSRANDLVVHLAHLIGRRMARENFERRRMVYQRQTRPEPGAVA